MRNILREEQGDITIDSCFKGINIRNISKDYKYIGSKEECSKYITKTLQNMSKEVYAHKTVSRTYHIADVSDAVSLPGHQHVEY